jgi:hypothetical protein
MDINIHEVYREQIKALNSFIEDCFDNLPNKDNSLIRFGGGTALSIYYFQHRRSFDIDLFVTDPQIIGYLSPKHWIEDSKNFNPTQYIDQANHVRVLSREKIKVDILVAQDFINEAFIDKSKSLFIQDVYVESIEDIIAKKITYRRKDNKTRDILDIAVALFKNQEILKTLYAKEAIDRNDVVELKEAISNLNVAEYESELQEVEPFGKYMDIALDAPKAIVAECETLLHMKIPNKLTKSVMNDVRSKKNIEKVSIDDLKAGITK